jgi:hypothetical protein
VSWRRILVELVLWALAITLVIVLSGLIVEPNR